MAKCSKDDSQFQVSLWDLDFELWRQRASPRLYWRFTLAKLFCAIGRFTAPGWACTTCCTSLAGVYFIVAIWAVAGAVVNHVIRKPPATLASNGSGPVLHWQFKIAMLLLAIHVADAPAGDAIATFLGAKFTWCTYATIIWATVLALPRAAISKICQAVRHQFQNYTTGKSHMLTMPSDIQVWNRLRKQNEEEATTKNNKRGISRNETEGVRWQCSKCCTCQYVMM